MPKISITGWNTKVHHMMKVSIRFYNFEMCHSDWLYFPLHYVYLNQTCFEIDTLKINHVMSWCLTHWGRVTHICVSKPTIIASDNGLSPGGHQAIIWTSAEILLIGPLGTNFSEILIEIITFSFKKMRLKVSSAKWRPCCLGLNVSTVWPLYCTV